MKTKHSRDRFFSMGLAWEPVAVGVVIGIFALAIAFFLFWFFVAYVPMREDILLTAPRGTPFFQF